MTLVALDLDRIGPGFVDPVHGAQRSFRAVLEAMSRPGRIQSLPATLLEGPPAPGLSVAATAALLALLDAEVSLWLCPALSQAGAQTYLRFHTGVQLVDRPEQADTVVTTAAQAPSINWDALRRGSDAAPEDGATLLIDAAGLDPAANDLTLRGPGIETEHRLGAWALDRRFWAARERLAPAYPCGIDLLLCDAETVAALPRTTRVTTED